MCLNQTFLYAKPLSENLSSFEASWPISKIRRSVLLMSGEQVCYLITTGTTGIYRKTDNVRIVTIPGPAINDLAVKDVWIIT